MRIGTRVARELAMPDYRIAYVELPSTRIIDNPLYISMSCLPLSPSLPSSRSLRHFLFVPSFGSFAHAFPRIPLPSSNPPRAPDTHTCTCTHADTHAYPSIVVNLNWLSKFDKSGTPWLSGIYLFFFFSFFARVLMFSFSLCSHFARFISLSLSLSLSQLHNPR